MSASVCLLTNPPRCFPVVETVELDHQGSSPIEVPPPERLPFVPSWNNPVQKVVEHDPGNGILKGDALALASLDPSTGILKIEGSDRADTVTVHESGNKVVVCASTEGVEYFREPCDEYDQSQVKGILFRGHGGDDEFANNTSIPSTAYGGEGNDSIQGGSARDQLLGGSGDDSLAGGEGNDQLYGGKGNDVLSGDDGNDLLFGNAGNDSLYGGEGEDRLRGGKGKDLLDGGNDRSADQLIGGAGPDTFQQYFPSQEFIRDYNAMQHDHVITCPAGPFPPGVKMACSWR